MPSPFPGMDPYLENPHSWGSVHHLFITFIAASLNDRLPEDFVARPDERLYVVQHERPIVPDVYVSHRMPAGASERLSSGVALLERADEPATAVLQPEE